MTSDNETIIRSIRTLHDLSKAINSTLDITRVEEMLLQQTSQLMGSAKVVILLLDEEKRSLTIHNAFGFEPSELPPARSEDIHPVVQLEQKRSENH